MRNSRYHTLVLLSWILALASLGVMGVRAATPSEARVTRIIRDVKLLPSEAKPRPASIDDKVKEGTGIRTGDQSRSELTFVDLTITRLGANSMFSFNRAGHSVDLGGGSLLLSVPKDTGGARISSSAVTVGITGTTLILESMRGGRTRLMMLEGSARLALKSNPSENVVVRGGQMEDVPAGATKLPPPVNIDVNDLMKKHPLITDFPPLPNRDAIYAGPSQPSGGGGPGLSVNVPVLGTLVGPVPFRPNIPRQPTNPGTNDGVETGMRGQKGTKDKGKRGSETTSSTGMDTSRTPVNSDSVQALSSQPTSKARPHSTPVRRKKPRGR